MEYFGNAFKRGENNFHTFPEDSGWVLDENYKLHQRLEGGIQRKTPSVNFNQFLQSWLFFGLLFTVLEGDEELHQGAFIYNESTITTIDLPDYLAKWEKRESLPRSKDDQTLRMIKAQVALDKAHKVVLEHCSFDEDKGTPAPNSPKRVDGELALSLMILGETLVNAKCKIVERVGFNVRGWHGDASEGWGVPLIVVDTMRKKG